MAYLKPQSPLQKGTDYIYPLTTADQVLVGDEERLNAKLASAVYLDASTTEDGAPESVNADTLGGKPAGYYAQPYNLLDNSDFRNPVNQRRETSYCFDSGYTIDRWKLHWSGAEGTITINNGYISLHRPVANNAYLFQNIPLELGLIGKTVTLAAKVRGNGAIGFCFGDGTTARLSVAFNTDNWKVITFTTIVPSYSYESTILNGVELRCGYGSTADFEWVALYEGEYTPETLPPYRPKGYAVELAECKRYFQFVCLIAKKTTGSLYAICYNHGMRITPTCEIKQFSPYGNANVTDMAGCSMDSDIGCIAYATLPTCTAHDAGGLYAYLHADL